jgi:hypothetical protein
MVESCVVELRIVDDGGAAGVVRSVDQGQHLTGHSISHIYKNFSHDIILVVNCRE